MIDTIYIIQSLIDDTISDNMISIWNEYKYDTNQRETQCIYSYPHNIQNASWYKSDTK